MQEDFMDLARSSHHGPAYCECITRLAVSSTAQALHKQMSKMPILKQFLIPNRSFYHTACIKLLSPFIQLPFLEFPRGRPARALSLEHSESLISILKEYNAAFSGRQDYWLLHTCEIAVKHLLLEKNLLDPTEDYLAKGCELLYSIGRYMPQANRILDDVNNHIKERNIEVSDRIKTMLQAGSTRVRPTIIANASYLQLDPTDAKRMLVGSMAFNEAIESIAS